MRNSRGWWILMSVAFLFVVSVAVAQPLPPPPGAKPSPKEITKIETKIEEVAKEKGFTTKRDDKGRLIMVDKEGNVVPPPPPPGMGKPLPKEEIEKLETQIEEVAKEKGFTTKRDEQGRLVMVDKEGNVVPPPPPPGMGKPLSKEEIEKIEAKITAYAKENNLKLGHDPMGRLVALDENGKPVPLETIMGEEADDDADDADEDDDADETEATTTSTTEDPDSPDDAVDQTQ